MNEKKYSISINDISKIRKIINLIINILEESINDFSEQSDKYNENKELINFLIGSKDNVVSIITKLTNLLVKLIPLEEKFMLVPESTNNDRLNSEDIEILEKYIDKCGILINKSNME